MDKLRAAVIGLGQIGMGYDFSHAAPDLVLTHAKAFATHPNFELIGGTDQDVKKQNAFTEKYGAPAFTDIKSLLTQTNPEVIAVSTNTSSHYSICKEIIAYRPKAIICEKPICYSIKEAKELKHLSDTFGVPILVNYIRRYEPGALETGRLLKGNIIGRLQRGNVYYTKGLYNNASHFIDLLSCWFGAPELIHVSKKIRDFPKDDIELDFILRFMKTEISFHALKEECFTLAEINLFGESGKLSYLEGGGKIHYWKTRVDPGFPGYQILEENPSIVKNDILRYQHHVAEGLFQFLSGNRASLPSNIDDAILTLEIVDQIRKNVLQAGEV